MSMYHQLNDLPVSIEVTLHLYGKIYPEQPDAVYLTWTTSPLVQGSEFFLIMTKQVVLTPEWKSAIDLTRDQVKALREKINAIRAKMHMEIEKELESISKLEAIGWNGESAV